MLRFIFYLTDWQSDEGAYFNTTLVKVHPATPELKLFSIIYFNTTLVKVHPKLPAADYDQEVNFNTTLVKVHRK